MSFNENRRQLAIELFKINAIKFGEFKTKSGLNTPIYFDLRVIVSYPEVMELTTALLKEIVLKNKCDHICGVPYTALPIATLLSIECKRPMLMRRKEAKSYGTKKMIEGHYNKGQSCLIIEDVVTSGSSVLETVKDLRNEGLIANNAIIILDREQGGLQNLKNNNVIMKSIFTLSELIDILLEEQKITIEMSVNIKNYIKQNKAPTINKEIDRTTLSYEERSKLATNPISKRLFDIMATKKTNLCLSVDMISPEKVLELIESVGEHVCLVKTHIDILEDFSETFISKLKLLAKKFNFLIMEDRKYADIGHTVALQYSKGLYKVSEWADMVTAHSLPGEGILKGFDSVSNGARCGIILLAEMSSEGNLFTQDYTEATVKMAEKYPQLITGFVCQTNTFKNPGLLQMTPGVQLESSKDGLGQVYNTPRKIILENGADIAIVGRGIIESNNPMTQALLYKETLWKYYQQRTSKN